MLIPGKQHNENPVKLSDIRFPQCSISQASGSSPKQQRKAAASHGAAHSDSFQVTCHQISNSAHKQEQCSLVHSGSRDFFLREWGYLLIYPTLSYVASCSQEPRETQHISLRLPPVHAQGWLESGRQEMKCPVPQPGNRGFLSLSLGLAQSRRCSAGCCLHQPASGCHSNHS